MKSRNCLKQIKYNILCLSEGIYMVILALLTIRQILSFVSMDLVWERLEEASIQIPSFTDFFPAGIEIILLILVLVRFLCRDPHDFRVILSSILIYIITAYAVRINQYEDVRMMILLMLGAYGISFRRLMKVHFSVVFVVVSLVIFASQIGWIENLIYTPYGRSIRMAFGFTYPTRFASHIFFLMLWYWYLRGKKLTWMEILLPIAAGIFLWRFCDARLNTVLLFSLSLLMLFQKAEFLRIRHRAQPYRMNEVLSWVLSLSATVCAAVTTLLTLFYHAGDPFFDTLNGLLSSRLYLCKKAVDMFGFRTWGQWIRLAGNGGYLVNNPKYFYIDSAFLQFSIQYGLVMCCMLLLLFWVVGVRARKNHEWILLWVLGLVSVHGMIEPQLLALQYCPLILAAFAGLGDRRAGA